MMAAPPALDALTIHVLFTARPYFRSPSALVPERNGMNMPKHDLSSRHFQRKISEFCEVRIAPISSKRVLENIRPYLASLIICRKRPPILNGYLDWTAIGEACGIEDEMTAELRKQLRPALDAIIRWLKAPPVADDVSPAKPSARTGKAEAGKNTAATSSTRKLQRAAADVVFARNTSAQRGPAPKPISAFPDPLFEATDDPASFQDALIYHMRRFGDSYWQLYRAVVRLTETFDSKTLLSWIQGERVPRSVVSLDILRRIETRYRLPEGYFKKKLPHQARSLYGHDLGDISPAERRRISLHLPDDFSSLPFTKREEILGLGAPGDLSPVRRNIAATRRQPASSAMRSAFPASPMAAVRFRRAPWHLLPVPTSIWPRSSTIRICCPVSLMPRRVLRWRWQI